MTAAQIHRGPDAQGLHQSERAVLCHRRLSILDLSDSGRQPMSNEDGAIWVVYNGEIYNYLELRSQLLAAGHIFRSRSDTEVLVHGYEQWGIESLLNKLRGMFAFGIYDARAGLVLARDRVGIKPLYYAAAGGQVLFASEVKALLRSGLVPADADPEAMIAFLMAGSIPSPLTTIRAVRCLPPGHYAVANEQGVRLHQYWNLPAAPASSASSASSSASASASSSAVAAARGAGIPACHVPIHRDVRLSALLQDTVARHLISDVPVGVFLSGGVDSAAIVALAARVRRNLQTLTVTFDEREFTEAGQAAQIAQHFHTEHQAIRVTAADFQREMPAFLRAMDQPTNDGLNTYFVSRAAREAGLKVVLSGLGGDEVFWGYPHYRWLAKQGVWLSRAPAAVRRILVGALSAAGSLRGRESWRRSSYIARQASTGGLYLMFRGFFAPEQVASLLGAGRDQVEAVAQTHFADLAPAGTGPEPFNHLEMKRYLHDQLLRDTDVFSMAHSIEVRVPLLDHQVLECVSQFPASQKLDSAVNKPLLVDAVNDPLVLAAAVRRKRGFSFPMDPWMKRSAGALEEMSQASKLLDRRTVNDCWNNFRAGRLHWSRAWALTVLGGVPRPAFDEVPAPVNS